MFSYATTAQSVPTCIRDTFRLYKQSLKSLVCLLPFLLVDACCIVSLPFLVKAMRGSLPMYPAYTRPELIALYSFLFVLLILAAVCCSIVNLYNLHAIASGNPVSTKVSFSMLRAKFWQVLPASLMFYVVVLLGLISWVLPGLFLLFLLKFYAPLIIFDDVSIKASLKESAGLVWGNWWRTLGVFILPILIFQIVRIPEHVLLAKMPFALWSVSVVTTSFLIPLVYCTTLVQFNNLKLVKSMKVAQVESKL